MSNIVKETNEGIQRGIEMTKRFTGLNSKSSLQAKYNLIESEIKRIESIISKSQDSDERETLLVVCINLQSEQMRILEKLIK